MIVAVMASAVLVLFANLGTARQASGFNVSSAIAAKYSCGKECYDNLQQGLAYDRTLLGTDFDFDFYATAHNFSTSKPGDVLKFKPIKPKSLSGVPTGMSAYKFQYTSQSWNGTKVPVTGFIAFPFASPQNNRKYRTIAFAHGTLGVFRGCAPSTSPNLYDYNSWSLLIDEGYAVIATDYAGLGNDFVEHEYVNLPEHALDVFWSVVAARKLFGHVLSHEWASVGHSQGGGAVWALAESKLLRDPRTAGCAGKYLGTVAIAPATKVYDEILDAINYYLSTGGKIDAVQGVPGEAPWLAYGIHRRIAGDKFGWLGDKLKRRLSLAKRVQSCYGAMIALVADLEATDVLNLGTVFNNTELENFQKVAGVPTGGHNRKPVLVVQGVADEFVLANTTIRSWNTSCASGNEVHLQLYPLMDHSPSIQAGAPSWLEWLRNRFSGLQTSGRCSKLTVTPFDTANTYAPLEVDSV